MDGGKTFKENVAACEIVGVKIVQINMHNGVVRILTGRRHVQS